MDCTGYPIDYSCFKIGYCGQPNLPYSDIQFKKSTNLILSHFQEEDHPLIHDTLKKKQTQFFSLYFIYRPKNAPRTDITNNDQNSYTFAPTYVDESTAYHRHIISVVVFFYSNTLKIMLMDCVFTEMGCFGDYLYATLHVKTIRGNGITTFLLHVSKFITFHPKQFVTSTLISEVLLESFYSR